MAADSENINISVGSTQVGLGAIESPDKACKGDQITFRIPVDNSGECSASARLIFRNELTGQSETVDEFNISRQTTLTKSQSTTIPEGAINQSSADYSFILQLRTSDGFENQDSQTETVNIGGASGSISEITNPSSRCAGSDANVVVTSENSGDCVGEFRVVVNGQVEDQTNIGADSSTTSSFTRSISLSDRDAVSYDIALEKKVGESWEQEDAQSITIDVLVGQLAINSVSGPNSSCIGREFTGEITIAAQNRCESFYRVSVRGPLDDSPRVVQSDSIANSNEVTVSFDESIDPQLADQDQVNYTVIVEKRFTENQDWIDVATQNLSVQVLTPDIAIDSINHPTERCVGSQFSPSVTFTNSGQCSTQYRLSVSNSLDDKTEVVISGRVGAEEQMTDRYDETITGEQADADSIEYTITVERKLSENTEWEPVNSQSFTVEVLLPQARIESNPYPEFTRPSEKTTDITVTNDSQCSTRVTLTINGNEVETKTLSAGGSTTFTDQYTLLTDSVEKEVVVNDELLGEAVDTINTQVTPHKFLNVNQSEGVLELVGGFEKEVPYSGNMVATAFSEGDNLEEQDRLFGALGVESIVGTMLPEDVDKDTVEFGALKALNIQTSEPVTIVVDSEIQERSRTYQHSTATSSILQLNEGEADVRSISGPLSNAGSLRRRVGLEPRVLGGPFLTVTRND